MRLSSAENDAPATVVVSTKSSIEYCLVGRPTGSAGVGAAEPYLPFGIVWPEPWSLPMVARA